MGQAFVKIGFQLFRISSGSNGAVSAEIFKIFLFLMGLCLDRLPDRSALTLFGGTWAYLQGSCDGLRQLLAAWTRCGLKALLFHFSTSYKIWNCHCCYRPLWPFEAAYFCECCDDMVVFCVRCKTKNDTSQCSHRHRLQCEVLNLTVKTAAFQEAKTAGEALMIAFQVYSERPCLGSCPSHKSHESSSLGHGCNWHSYAEVGRATQALAVALRRLLHEEKESLFGKIPMVGLLGAVSKEWFITDFACTIAGIPLVTMHRATDEKALAHIIEESGLRVLIVSEHLLPVTFRVKSQLKMLIWIHDSSEAYCLQHSKNRLDDFCEVVDPPNDLLQISWAYLLQQGNHWVDTDFPMDVGHNGKSVIKLLPSSGTTGLPKLVPVTEDVLFKDVSMNLQCSADVIVYATWWRLDTKNENLC